MFLGYTILRGAKLLKRVFLLNNWAQLTTLNGIGNPLHGLGRCLGRQQETHATVREQRGQHRRKTVGRDRHHAPARLQVVAVKRGHNASAVQDRIEFLNLFGVWQSLMVVCLNRT